MTSATYGAGSAGSKPARQCQPVRTKDIIFGEVAGS